jgi:hypothetical protein
MLKSTAEAKGQEEEDLWRVLDPHDASGHTVLIFHFLKKKLETHDDSLTRMAPVAIWFSHAAFIKP